MINFERMKVSALGAIQTAEAAGRSKNVKG